jgi:hypothetical protein
MVDFEHRPDARLSAMMKTRAYADLAEPGRALRDDPVAARAVRIDADHRWQVVSAGRFQAKKAAFAGNVQAL